MALIVIDVFIEAIGMSSNRVRMSPICEIGDADLADLAARQRVVAVKAGLGGQIEGDRQSRLALGEILPIEPVGFAARRMAGVGAEDPGFVASALRSALPVPLPPSLSFRDLAAIWLIARFAGLSQAHRFCAEAQSQKTYGRATS